MSATLRSGVVLEFDQDVGLGTVADGRGERFDFHCTQIADGSRTIAVGANVRFEVVPGRRGSWEAARLAPAPA